MVVVAGLPVPQLMIDGAGPLLQLVSVLALKLVELVLEVVFVDDVVVAVVSIVALPTPRARRLFPAGVVDEEELQLDEDVVGAGFVVLSRCQVSGPLNRYVRLFASMTFVEMVE